MAQLEKYREDYEACGLGSLTCDFRVGISVRFFPGGFWHHQISWLEVGLLVGELVILQIHDVWHYVVRYFHDETPSLRL